MSNSNKKPLTPGDAMLLRALHERLGEDSSGSGGPDLIQDLYHGLDSRVAQELGRKLLHDAGLKPERRKQEPRRTSEAS